MAFELQPGDALFLPSTNYPFCIAAVRTPQKHLVRSSVTLNERRRIVCLTFARNRFTFCFPLLITFQETLNTPVTKVSDQVYPSTTNHYLAFSQEYSSLNQLFSLTPYSLFNNGIHCSHRHLLHYCHLWRVCLQLARRRPPALQCHHHEGLTVDAVYGVPTSTRRFVHSWKCQLRPFQSFYCFRP